MKKFFRFALLTLVLIVVALVSALTTMRYAIHGREIEVPNLVNKTPAEARRIAEEEGFGLSVEQEYYSATVTAGKILSQAPPAGTLVRRGWEIRVAQSLGAQRVQVPNVEGESERAAEMNIARHGLNVSSVAEVAWPSDAVDQVIAQSPSPTASSISDPKIGLLVASQPAAQAFLMPSLIGQPLGKATNLLQNAGLRLGTVSPAQSAGGASTGPSAASPTSLIASQNPAPGDKVISGATINFQVQ